MLLGLANDDISILIVRMVRIVEINIEWISENSFCFVERNFVLRQISFGLCFDPTRIPRTISHFQVFIDFGIVPIIPLSL